MANSAEAERDLVHTARINGTFRTEGPGGHLEVVCKSYVSGDFADLVGQKAVRVTCFHRNEWQRDISC